MSDIGKMMLTGLLWAGLVLAQNPNTAVFPASVATDTDLLVQSNQATTTLNGAINDSTLLITLTDATDFVFPGIITIDTERIKVCSKVGNVLTVCVGGRGFDGSAEASHVNGRAVYGYLTRYEHNQIAAEVKAMQALIPTYFLITRNTDGDSVDVKGGIMVVGSKRTDLANATGCTVVIAAHQHAFWYWQNGTPMVGMNTGVVVCSGWTYASGITEFPAGSVPLWMWPAGTVANHWDSTGQEDWRATVGGESYYQDVGIIMTPNGTTGRTAVAVDTATTPQFSSGTASASGPCTIGQIYIETDAAKVSVCTATNTWTALN